MWLDRLAASQRETMLDLAHSVIVSDGLLDPNEECMLDQFRREMALSPEHRPRYVAVEGMERVFDSQRARRIALINLIQLSYVDGALEIEEECLLRELAGAFGVEDDEFALLENWVKRLAALHEEGLGLL
jgi:tellurite resistance protein